MLSRLATSLVFSRRRSSTLILALLRWFGTAVVVVAAAMAVTVAAAAVDSVVVSLQLIRLERGRCSLTPALLGRTQGANGANAMPVGNRRW